MDQSLRLFPQSASSMSHQVDTLFFYLLAVSGFFTLLILVLIVYFGLKYRRKSDDPPPEIKTNIKLELTWTIIPLILAMTMFVWGAKLYVKLFTPPKNALEIYVIGKQWMWQVQHTNGTREINQIHVPVGRPVRLIATSQDVIHDLSIPAFRIKHDVLPGRPTSIWFEATRTGVYHLFCMEYCGMGHSQMIGQVIVMEPQEYAAWLAGTIPDAPPAEAGAMLFRQLGCIQCHGSQAPTLSGLYGSQVKLSDGRTVTADEEYLRESILDSTAKIVAGYPPIMPSFRGQLSEEQLIQLIAYIKSMKEPPQNIRQPWTRNPTN